ncbi:MAG: anti-sigma factor family protein, partial [Planctomycetota bacterium]
MPVGDLKNYWAQRKEVAHMTCHDYKDLMMSYLDDELSAEQRQQFEEHLAECPE